MTFEVGCLSMTATKRPWMGPESEKDPVIIERSANGGSHTKVRISTCSRSSSIAPIHQDRTLIRNWGMLRLRPSVDTVPSPA